MIDYRELLKKYMNHVIECEGIPLVDSEFFASLNDLESAQIIAICKEVVNER